MIYRFLAIILFIRAVSANAQNVEIPEINFVTVNQITAKPVINWSVNDPSVITGYAVKRFIRSHPSVPDNTWHTVKIISDAAITEYEDISSIFGEANPDIHSEIYEVTAFKVNGTDTVYSLPGTVHKTIFLTAEYDYCEKSVNLKWSNYEPWQNSFSKYEIYIKKDAGNFVKTGEKNYGDTTFIINNVSAGSNYDFYVKALKSDGTESVSNIKQIFASGINLPSYCKADYLAVTENQDCFIRFIADMNSDIKSFALYKNNGREYGYTEIDEIPNENFIPEFTDKNFNPEQINSYFVACRDYCGNNIFYSDTVSNTVLKTEAFSENIRYNMLEWNDLFSEGNYEIFRKNDDNDYQLIANTNEHYFKDDLSRDFENQFYERTSSGEFCYFVIFKKNDFTSKSNIECAEQNEVYYFPNAFNPESSNPENRIFKPKAAFISDFTLTVYGPYGNIIFETENPNEGWDGKMKNGKLAPVAAYLYFAKFKNSSGKIIKIKNFVNLVY